MVTSQLIQDDIYFVSQYSVLYPPVKNWLGFISIVFFFPLKALSKKVSWKSFQIIFVTKAFNRKVKKVEVRCTGADNLKVLKAVWAVP